MTDDLNIPLDGIAIAPHKNAAPRFLFSVHPTIESGLILRIDNSTLERFQTCPRSSEFYCLDRRQKPGGPALTFGKAFHAGLENYFTGQPLPVIRKAILDAFDESPVPPGEYRDPMRCLEVVAEWISDNPTLPWNFIHDKDGSLFIERSFDLVIGEVEINDLIPYSVEALTGTEGRIDNYISTVEVHWCGRIDAAVTFPPSEALWVLDHKTTKMGGPQWKAEFNLSQPTIGYCWALQQLFPGRQIGGFYLNAAIVREKTRTGRGTEFDHENFYYPQWKIDEWVTNVSTHVADFLSHLQRGMFPAATKWCYGKYGACSYVEVCTLPPEQRHGLLHSGVFQNVTWNPLTSEG